MKKSKFIQCRLEKKASDKTSQTNALIPEKFAKLGKIVKIKDSKEKWNDGWKVVAVSSISMDLEEVLKIEDQHKNHRKVSDI